MALDGSTQKDLQTDRTRKRIKAAARRLFAERGVGAVSIRDIVRAAGQKNVGAVNYHFQSKEALILEIADEIARAIDRHRLGLLEALEAGGGPRSLREVAQVLTSFPPRSKTRMGPDDVPVRLVNTLFLEYRELLARTLTGEADQATRRCMDHISRFLPGTPHRVLRQRFIFAVLGSTALLASREVAEQQPEAWHGLWGAGYAEANLVDAMEGMLRQPVSQEVLTGLKGEPSQPF